jgi:dolichol-phosphate mannosyltransferase
MLNYPNSKESNLSQSWSVIVLCYNEEGNIAKAISDIAKTLKMMNISVYEILVIDDGSTDNSPSILATLPEKFKSLKIITHPKNLGIGAGLRTGYKNASNENVMATCSDGQFNLKDLIFIKNIPTNTIISFYRENKDKYTIYRQLVSNLNLWLNKYLLGIEIRDVNWQKIYKKDNLDSIELELQSSLIETEIIAKLVRKSVKIREFPSASLDRLSGEAKGASFKILVQAILELTKLIYLIKIKRN